MTLQQIKYFISVAESGSISEAAKRLFTAQSSISSAIKEIENTYYCIYKREHRCASYQKR